MNASAGNGRTVLKPFVSVGCRLYIRVNGKQRDSEDERVILEPVRQSYFQEWWSRACQWWYSCITPSAPLCAVLTACVGIVFNDPHSVKMGRNYHWDHYIFFYKKTLRKPCLLCLLKQPEREQKQNWFEKLYLESIILVILLAGMGQCWGFSSICPWCILTSSFY